MIVVISFQILLFNLIIALLSKTYSIFENRSNGLFLKKILSKRSELIYDEYCGSFLVSIPPLDCFQLLFVPICIHLPYGSPLLKKLNDFQMVAQYVLFMLFTFFVFLAVSLALLPFAWIIGIIDKTSNSEDTDKQKQTMNIIVFAVLGIPILMADMCVDAYYFWYNNFRNNLNKIIIIQEKSTITNKTLREISLVCK